ncbi:hypothetical protein [Ilumatobacter sp.]|uniref:hypothetical protein n=1 Tax=Ilumatobacter sp. TaxID=1967498 RepID=UPI003B51DF08
MGAWMDRRRLRTSSTRLSTLRAELAVVDEQLRHLGDDADDHEVRALVAESTAASRDARHARQHVDAMRRHRVRVHDEIAELEALVDALLDRMGGGA